MWRMRCGGRPRSFCVTSLVVCVTCPCVRGSSPEFLSDHLLVSKHVVLHMLHIFVSVEAASLCSSTHIIYLFYVDTRIMCSATRILSLFYECVFLLNALSLAWEPAALSALRGQEMSESKAGAAPDADDTAMRVCRRWR